MNIHVDLFNSIVQFTCGGQELATAFPLPKAVLAHCNGCCRVGPYTSMGIVLSDGRTPPSLATTHGKKGQGMPKGFEAVGCTHAPSFHQSPGQWGAGARVAPVTASNGYILSMEKVASRGDAPALSTSSYMQPFYLFCSMNRATELRIA